MRERLLQELMVEATGHTLRVLAGIESKAGKSSTITGALPFTDLVCASIELIGAKDRGMLSVCFPESCFLRVASAVLQEEASSINENESLAAEFLNMVHGRMKTRGIEVGVDLTMARPVLHKGEEAYLRKFLGGVGTPFVIDGKNGFLMIIKSKMQEAAA